jgi:hypothetical protein
MNKYSIGVILGTALLSTAKRLNKGSSALSMEDFVKRKLAISGFKDGQLSFEVKLPEPIISSNISQQLVIDEANSLVQKLIRFDKEWEDQLSYLEDEFEGVDLEDNRNMSDYDDSLRDRFLEALGFASLDTDDYMRFVQGFDGFLRTDFPFGINVIKNLHYSNSTKPNMVIATINNPMNPGILSADLLEVLNPITSILDWSSYTIFQQNQRQQEFRSKVSQPEMIARKDSFEWSRIRVSDLIFGSNANNIRKF